MAHEIDETTGTAACFVTGQPAWHKLGRVVSEAQTSEAAIGLAGLNWKVDLFGMSAKLPAIGGAKLVDVPNNYAVVRSDTSAVLGVVGNWYKPFQNVEAFDFMDSIVGEKLAMFETAGALKGGRRVWMMARLPREIRAAGDDVINPYVLVTNSHDGTSGLRIIPTSVRVVCQNTLNLALRQAGNAEGLTIVHTASLEARVADARRKLGVIVKRFDKYEEEVHALVRRKMTTQQLGEFFAGLVADRAEKQQRKLIERFSENLHNPRNEMRGIEQTAWAAYNAVSEWADHEIAVRGETEMDKLDARCNSIWFGTANTFKQAAWEAAIALAV